MDSRLRTDRDGLARNITRVLRRRREDRKTARTSAPSSSHDDLCFGCGNANVFGLQLEAHRGPGRAVGGRFFVKQDHQGPSGAAHPGVVAAALLDAMALAAEVTAPPESVNVDLHGEPPVGVFVEVSARVERRERGMLAASAEAALDGERMASARAVYRV